MSVIAVKKHKDKIVICADSITVRGYTKTDGSNTTFSKLFRNESMIVGSSGYCSELAHFELFTKTRKPKAADCDSLLQFMKEFSDWKSFDTYTIDNQYIICFGNKVFLVQGWLVQEVTTFEAIGAGEDYALTAMHLGHSPSKAVKVAIDLSIYCEGPVQVMECPIK